MEPKKGMLFLLLKFFPKFSMFFSRKIFVGGLSWETNEGLIRQFLFRYNFVNFRYSSNWNIEKLRNYFGEFGNVTECLVMKNPETGKSRGFGFVSFLEPNSVQKVLNVSNHQLDGRTVSFFLTFFSFLIKDYLVVADWSKRM